MTRGLLSRVPNLDQVIRPKVRDGHVAGLDVQRLVECQRRDDLQGFGDLVPLAVRIDLVAFSDRVGAPSTRRVLLPGC